MSGLASIAVVGSGVASHLFYFKHGEHHKHGVRYIQSFSLICIVTVLVRNRIEGVSIGLALASTLAFACLYLVGLCSSVLVWRLFFNPLNRFPGPYGARVTQFHQVFQNTKLDRHHNLQKLHQKYGPYVRTGPNDLSIIDPRGVSVVGGGQSRCVKAPWYDGDAPLTSLHTTRDRADHDRRRRIWSPAFSDKALRGYEVRIQKYNDLLINQIDARAGQPMNMSTWFNLYSFDVMGDLGFGQSFDSLEAGDMHWATRLLCEGLDPMGFGMPDWFFGLLVAIPGLAAGYHRFVAFCSQRLDDRMKQHGKSDTPDITHVLIDDYNKNGVHRPHSLRALQADTRLIIVAGSDTTAATLVHMFYHLAGNPVKQEEIRQEVMAASPDGKAHGLHEAQLLNGTINEALRLNPPVPSGVFRKTPKEGVNIGETYISGNTVIAMPQYVMGHDESIYTHADSFIPERWSSQPELVKDKDAFAPFSVGPYNCIGKNVAYMELRTLTAQLLSKFDVSFAPGEDGSTLLAETKDHFTLELAALNLVFTKRT